MTAPPALRLRLRLRVTACEQRIRAMETRKAPDGSAVAVASENLGWFITLGASGGGGLTLGVGPDDPLLRAGDEVEVTIAKR